MEFSKEHNQRVLRMLHNKYAREVTPDQLQEVRRQAYDVLRQELVRRGVPPLTDQQLFMVLDMFKAFFKEPENGNADAE